ncbi:hypothetical protein OED01_05480 [Microbacterium sp. M28]|uniref:hypothetical protein n=1 Tax=Microbacterium sp. M28 TaxID=2962064 RepID=UPI0021F4A54A|nr:hypothetical protein [Microbacterium sp. M28]UYO98160.1 hypothetical protein OED01_05480 [Microbacterium sp. M28]
MSVSPRVVARQRRLFALGLAIGRIFRILGPRVDWIIGVEEIAGVLGNIAAATPRSFSVVRRRHPFYDTPYDVVLQDDTSRFEALRRLYGGALVLGVMLPRAKGVIYVGSAGFLDGNDERDWEFQAVRRAGKALVCWFTGNDIRSARLSAQWGREHGLPTIGEVLLSEGAPYTDDAYEETRVTRSRRADDYAHAVITANVDQISHLTTATDPFLYFYPDENFGSDLSRFDDPARIVVLHAPSHPRIKGTEAVRTTMSAICARHPDVEYRELMGVPNQEVLAALDETHIVINQLNAQMPGVFGIESMARSCVMVCSADPTQDPDLSSAVGAWVVSTANDLESTLEDLLSRRETLAEQARRGHDWALASASASACTATLARILDRALDRARTGGRSTPDAID